MYCKAHQKQKRQKRWVIDHKAKRAAETHEVGAQSLVLGSKIQIDAKQRYSREDPKFIEDLGVQIGKEECSIVPQNRLVVPATPLGAVIMAEHRKTHWETEALYKHLSQQIIAWNPYTTIKQVTQQREICLQNNPRTGPKVPLGQIGKGN